MFMVGMLCIVCVNCDCGWLLGYWLCEMLYGSVGFCWTLMAAQNGPYLRKWCILFEQFLILMPTPLFPVVTITGGIIISDGVPDNACNRICSPWGCFRLIQSGMTFSSTGLILTLSAK